MTTIVRFHCSRNFTLAVASCISVIMPGDLRVVCKQVRNNYVLSMHSIINVLHFTAYSYQLLARQHVASNIGLYVDALLYNVYTNFKIIIILLQDEAEAVY